MRSPWLALPSLFIFTAAGCASTGAVEEAMGRGIVHGTLGANQEAEVETVRLEHTHPVRGYVVALEGGAYVLQSHNGAEHRIPLDENTRIDRPAHVGDKIEALLDRGGRAVLIRNIDHDHDHIY